MLRVWRFVTQAVAEFLGYQGELTGRDRVLILVALAVVILLAMFLR